MELVCRGDGWSGIFNPEQEIIARPHIGLRAQDEFVVRVLIFADVLRDAFEGLVGAVAGPDANDGEIGCAANGGGGEENQSG